MTVKKRPYSYPLRYIYLYIYARRANTKSCTPGNGLSKSPGTDKPGSVSLKPDEKGRNQNHYCRYPFCQTINSGCRSGRSLHHGDERSDATIAALAEGTLSVTDSYVFVHNDAGISYAATLESLTKRPVTAIIFGEEAELMTREISFPCTIIAEPAIHNPMPLKRKLEEVAPWDV
jgi:hypothetical protein